MITVTVSKKNNSYVSFTSKGHAGYAEEGYDIICAAVSALIINTVNSLEQLTGDQIQAEESDGFVSFSFVKPVTKEGTLLMDSLSEVQDWFLQTGLRLTSLSLQND